MPPVALPTVLTPALLTALRGNLALPRGSWYFVAGVTLSALNRPDEVPRVLQVALQDEDGHAARLRVARRMREGLVKSMAVVGLPKTINALLSLKTGTPEELLDAAAGSSPSQRAAEMRDAAPSSIMQRGQRFFDRVYGKVSERVMGQMDGSGTEDLGLVARLMYGYVLSGGEAILAPAESSFVLLAALLPQDVNPQLKGHLKGALNNGASVAEVRAVCGAVVGICEAAGMRRLGEGERTGWGWRNEIAKL